MKIWDKKTQQEIMDRVFSALKRNVDYFEENILGVPASHLDSRVFSQDAAFLSEAPYISSLIHNPNHIGCHTMGSSESFFKGTQDIERELLELCSIDILKGNPGVFDGYVASGGTEANLQAVWIYRNYFIEKYGASNKEIGILCSADSHYSVDKASDIFGIDCIKVPVDFNTRETDPVQLWEIIESEKKDGVKYFIVIANMMTTLFGSVDDVDMYVKVLKDQGCEYKIHIDAAFGGFFYPFSAPGNSMDFSNPEINSVTLDAHKMAQAPYGTGIFLIRKGYMQYARTSQASYVQGEDNTLIGSRSGANAIAVWMILMKTGPYGWEEKIFVLLKRSDWFCQQLSDYGIEYYRHPQSNIIAIKQQYVPIETARKFGLVPDHHQKTNWYKVVVMEHVTIENLKPLLDELKAHDSHSSRLK